MLSFSNLRLLSAALSFYQVHERVDLFRKRLFVATVAENVSIYIYYYYIVS